MLNVLTMNNTQTQLEQAIIDIIGNLSSGKIRRGILHHILYDRGLMLEPGRDNRQFQQTIDAMERAGQITYSKTARATYISLR